MDIINGLFELLASLFILNNCYTLYKDKQVKGVSVISVIFFFSWGVWNIIYYPSLGQTFSFMAGVLVCLANALWIFMMLYYRRRGEKSEV